MDLFLSEMGVEMADVVRVLVLVARVVPAWVRTQSAAATKLDVWMTPRQKVAQ